jgi:hypothetical protein
LQSLNSSSGVATDPCGITGSQSEPHRAIPSMRPTRVEEILQPYQDDIPLHPSVKMGDKITQAIELMVRNNVKCITVLRNQRPIGLVRLEDAFRKIGLQTPRDRPFTR